MNKIAIVVLLATFAITPALADTAVYAGLKVGIANYNYSNVTANNSLANGFTGGYVANEKFAVEVEYHNLASVKTKTAKLLGDAWSLSAIESFPLKAKFSVFGKLGLTSTVLLSTNNSNTFDTYQRTGLVLGFGVHHALNKSYAVRVGFDMFPATSNLGRSSINMPYVGILYTP